MPSETRMQFGPIETIDLCFRGSSGAAAAFLVRTDEGPVLVECGPANTFQTLVTSLANANVQLPNVKHVFLTHIHLDHAGALGAVTANGTLAHVHRRGARHLTNTERLNVGSKMVFGDQFESSLGPIAPSPAECVHACNDGETIEIGNFRFTALDTPGHAEHHMCWLLEHPGGRELFTGDVAGMRLPGTDFQTLPMVPNQFDRERWLASIDRLQGMDFDRLWLTHMGRCDQPSTWLRTIRDRVDQETDLIESLLDDSNDRADMIHRYREWQEARASDANVPAELVKAYCHDAHYDMNISGVAQSLARREG